MELPKKALVIGLDGADPKVVTRLMDAGRMPALAALRDRGTFLPLASTIPPVSAPAWASFMTGRDPGGHGVYGFVEEDGAGGFRLMNLANVEGTKLWDAASAESKRVAVLNVPVTFPAPKVNGVFVTGMLTPPGRPFTEPPELTGRIAEIAPAYAPDIDRSLFGDRPRLLEHLTELIDARAEVFLDLHDSEPWDLFVCVFTETDRVQHHFWRDEMDEVHAFFERLDGHLGRLIERADDDTLVLVMSDHGFADTDRRFYGNEWLKQEGYLKLHRVREEVNDYEQRQMHAHLGEKVSARKSRGLVDRLAWMIGMGGPRAIHWEKTRAYLYSASSQGIEINLKGRQPEGCVEPGDYDAVRDEIVAKLEALTYPPTGEPVFSRVLRREDAYRGPFVKRAPDIVICAHEDRYRIVTHTNAKGVFRQHKKPEGYHGETGLLFVAGPGVRAGGRTDAELPDLMPTVLWAIDAAVPEGVNGRVLAPLFTDGAEAARPVRRSAEPEPTRAPDAALTPEEEEALKDSLRGLGYL